MNMRHRILAFIIAGIILLSTSAAVLASDISGALYYGNTTITNNSTATNNVSTVASINTTTLQSLNYLNASANNCVVRNTSGVDVTFMPGFTPDGYPWSFFVPSIGLNAYQTYILYTAESSGGDIGWFPDSTGGIVADNATIEYGDNFTQTVNGRINTEATTNGIIVQKDDAISTFVSPTTDGKILASIATTSADNITNNGGQDFAFRVFSNWWAAQTITANASGYLYCDNVSFMAGRFNAPGTLTMKIRAASGGVPYGDDLLSVDIGTVGMPAGDPAGAYTTYNIDQYFLGDSDEYAIILKTDAGDQATNFVGWYADNTTPAYHYGNVATSVDAGVSWSANTTADFNFGVNMTLTPVTVTATGVTSGEHEVTTALQTPFYVLGIDSGADILPRTESLEMNAALWQDSASISPFTTIDANALVITNSGGVWSGNGYQLNGVNQYLTTPDNAVLDFGTDNFTISVWAQSNINTGTHQAILSKDDYSGESPAGQAKWILYLPSSIPGAISFSVGGNYTPLAYNGGYVNDDTWHNFIVVRNGNTGYLYCDGVLRATVPNFFSGYSLSNDKILDIGRRGSSADRYWGGLIGEIQIYKGYSFNQNDVDKLYNATKTKFGVSGGIYHFSTLASVPDNANDYQIGSSATPYLGNASFNSTIAKFTIDGSDVSSWEWQYNSVFEDQEGNGNTLVPSFRSASSDADVSASLTSFLPVAEADAPPYVLDITASNYLPDSYTGNISATFSTTSDNGTFPLANVIRAISEAGTSPTPAQVPQLIIVAFTIIAASLSISYFMRRFGTGSLIGKTFVILALMGIFLAIGNFAVDLWMILIVILISLAIMFMSMHKSTS